jgi:hypothetical protein
MCHIRLKASTRWCRKIELFTWQTTIRIDLIKILTDMPLALYFGSMIKGRDGVLLSSRMCAPPYECRDQGVGWFF